MGLESGMFSVNKPKCNPAAVAEFSVSLCNAPKFRYFGRPGLLFRAPQLGSYTGTELQLGIPEFSEPGPGPVPGHVLELSPLQKIASRM